MLRLGEAAARLGELAGLDKPVSDPQAEHVLAAVRGLLDDFADLELRHDGETISSRLAGEQVKQLPAGNTQSGEVFVWVKSDPLFEITRFEVEGRLEPTSLDELRRAWVDARLVEMGFDG